MQAYSKGGRCYNQSVITPKVDNTLKTCMCLFIRSEKNKYKTNFAGDTRFVINPCVMQVISFWAEPTRSASQADTRPDTWADNQSRTSSLVGLMYVVEVLRSQVVK